MPFRLWNSLAKFVVFPLSLVGVALLFFPLPEAARQAGAICLLALFSFALLSGVLGVLMALGKLRMRCPFCGQRGPTWGNKRDGMRMECPSCGEIRTAGFMGLSFERENDGSRGLVGPSEESNEHEASGATGQEEMEDEGTYAIFPFGLQYFRQWRYLRWYVLLLTVPGIGCAARWNSGSALKLLSFLGVSLIGAILLVLVSSGIRPTTDGGYTREEEPARFWKDVVILFAIYIGLTVACWI